MLNIDDKYRNVTAYRGIETQISKYYEEREEFEIELSRMRYDRLHKSHENLEAEASDVINMIMQLVLYYGGSTENVISIATAKMIREEGRIADEKDELARISAR